MSGRNGRQCPTGKVCYWTRRKAKSVRKLVDAERRMSVYPCTEGELPAHFHLGNRTTDMQEVGRQGLRDRRAAAVQHG